MKGEGTGFDKKLAKSFNFELEFDEQKLHNFLEKANISFDSVPEQALYELNCGRLVGSEFVINNAGILFFSRKPERFVRDNYITCIKYKGDTVMHMIDRKEIYGDLVTLVDEAEKFVRTHTKLASKFEGFTRIDIEEYPYIAIREAIVNAVCHRDYPNGNNIFINIFDSRIEVISPGGIPNNLTLKEVWGKSNPRNKLIVELFHKLGEKYVEKAGTGLKRMEEEMIMKGLNKPRYEASRVFFTVTFKGPGDKIFDLVKPSDRTNLGELGLNERQIKVLNYIQEKGFITRKEYQKLYQVSKMTAFRDLNELVEKHNFIKVEGQSVSAKYFLT